MTTSNDEKFSVKRPNSDLRRHIDGSNPYDDKNGQNKIRK